MSSTAFAGFYKFTGDISYVWNQGSLAPGYSVGNSVTFVFRIDGASEGYTTQVDGDTENVSGINVERTYFAEYLGGDAILHYDNGLKASLDGDDTWEYNYAADLKNGSSSERSGALKTETASNWISVSTDWSMGTNPPNVANWHKYEDLGSIFRLIQRITWLDGGQEVWAQYSVNNMQLVEFTQELADMDLTGLAMKSMTATPIPGAVWLLGTGLLGLCGLRRKFSA
ncbi:hypothetical protein JCM14722_19830 [Pseudodesulfovibrio portus]|uniref:PEP-CTERM protein-sorting domain-containing protein n=2 Tax=Pseudodesulfovibrio portus TaxID=231439 RepID=A0ABM8ASM1_9BACT|nr:hypothetical protein JCM14722_19830 [Pseudodesulfovibrio portus]